MKITLLHPSRGRSAQAHIVRNNWLQLSSKKHEIEHILGVDESDPDKAEYIRLFKNDPLSTLIIANNDTVVQATNAIAQYAEGSILIYLSDDFDCPRNWDDLIVRSVERLVPHHVEQVKQPLWLLKVDDLLQENWKDVLTIPIMSHSLYRELGYFWHPGYKSMFVDQDLYHTVNNMGVLYQDTSLKFEHKHCSAGKSANDATYQRSANNWDQGLAFYKQRQKQKFKR